MISTLPFIDAINNIVDTEWNTRINNLRFEEEYIISPETPPPPQS